MVANAALSEGSARIYYKDPYFPVSIKRESLDHYPEQCTVLHYHEELEFLYVLTGQLREQVDGEERILGTHEGLFINSKVTHCTSRVHPEASFLLIQVHPDLLSASQIRKKYIDPVISDAGFKAMALGQQGWQREVLRYLKDMYEKREDPNAPLVITADFLNLWALIYGHYTDAIPAPEDPDLQIGKKMVGFIQKNYGEHLSLHDIAAAGGVSISKCSQVFQKCFETSPMLYLKEYRLDQASSMLLHENTPITEIALLAGYNDAAYFSRSFKNMTGMTPKVYRRMRGENKKQKLQSSADLGNSCGMIDKTSDSKGD